MRNSLLFGLLGMLLCLMTACSKDDTIDVVSGEITVSTTSLNFDSTGGSQTFTVITAPKAVPTVSSNCDWLRATFSQPKNIESGLLYTATVIVSENVSGINGRTGQLTIASGNGSNTKVITVTQETSSFLNVSSKTLSFDYIESTKSFTITASAKPEVSLNGADWLSMEVGDVTSDEIGFTQTVSITVKENTSQTSDRKAEVVISSGDQSISVTIEQNKAPYQPDYSNRLVPGDIPLISGSAKDAIAFANSLGMGWNLGNHMDANNNGVADETCWGNPKATQETFNKVKAAGIATVRVPVTYLGHIGNAPGYTIEESYLNRVAEIVGYAKKAGLKVIINIHHDGADSAHWLDIKSAGKDAAANEAVKAQLAAMWTQIANKFKNEGNYLIFEPFNEIHDGGWGWGDNRNDGGKQYACLNEWNQTFVDAVRATGGKNAERYLAVVGYCANPEITMEMLKIPTDKVKNRLIVGVHYYNPTTFSLECQFNEWGHTGTSKETYGDEKDVQWIFGNLKSTYIDKGIPVYMGEMGCSHFDNAQGEKFRLYYLEYICKAVREYGMAPVVWDNGAKGAGRESHGYFDHGNGDFIGDAASVIELMTRAYYTNDPGYTLDFVYGNAPKK